MTALYKFRICVNTALLLIKSLRVYRLPQILTSAQQTMEDVTMWLSAPTTMEVSRARVKQDMAATDSPVQVTRAAAASKGTPGDA